MKKVTVEDIYIELESIFDNIPSGLERRTEVYEKLNESLPKWEGNKNNCVLADVSKALVADIKNKLTPIKNLCKIIQDREVEPFMADDPRNEIVDTEIEIVLKNIEHLSNL